ncbi:UBN2_3 domain-containing protein [Cephalotus follicularis]|uniref:UBN2_3 domain-containing protein n=1 Tax=Cephalotus follicularis TaxID=3775 RepID=A0A1Q3D8L2_CEPFO|nr:UBN2_3 domain-containing protein [Cephalotus follicularis]
MTSLSTSSSSTSETIIPTTLTGPPVTNSAHHLLSLKLNETNYLSWRTQIVPFLRGQKLFGYVNGTIVCPVPTDVEAYNNWQQQDNNLMSILVGSLSAEVIPTVHQAPTSKQIRDTLQEAYASPSNTRILSLHLSLQNIEHKPDESITQFLQRTKTLHDELAAAGRPISLEDFNLYIFKALREDFKVMIPTLTARLDPLSFSELHGLLVSHEFFNKSALTKLSLNVTGDTPSVNTTERHPLPPSAPPGRGQGHSFPGRGSFRGRGHSRGRTTYRCGCGPNMWCSCFQRNNHTNNTCYYREQHALYGPQSFRPA